MLPTSLLTAALVMLTQSRPAEIAARFTGGAITMEELDRFMAVRFGKEPTGKEALDFAIRERVLELEAARRGVRVGADELRAALTRIENEIVAQTKRSLEEELALKGMDRATFEGIYRKQLLCEQMVRADLGIPKQEALRREQQELWLQEKVKSMTVVKDGLAPGIAATVQGSAISSGELGTTIRLKLSKTEVRDAARSLAALMLIELRAGELGLDADAKDVDFAIARRRDRFAGDPRMAGVSYEQFLKARGTTLEELRQDRGVKAEALLHKIGELLYADSEVDKRYAADRARYDGLFGEARRVSWILLHATPDKNQLIRRTYDDADSELRVLAARATSATEFARLATIHSTHDTTRQRGGDLGWLHRLEPGHEAPILAAVFAEGAGPDKVIGPVRNSQGSALIWITAIRPAPSPETVRIAIRADLVAEFYRKLIQDAKIATYLDPRPVDSRPSDVK